MKPLEVSAKQSFRYDSITSWLLSLSDVVTRGGEGVGGGELDEVSQKEQNSICKINNYQGCNV